MAGAVLRRMNCAAVADREEQQERSPVDIVETHPVELNAERQRVDVNSYAKTYTRHELAALVDRDFEQVGCSRLTTRGMFSRVLINITSR